MDVDVPNLLIVKKAHGKTSRHDNSDPLHVHLVLSNTLARHDVNVTEKLAVWRTRIKVRESDGVRNDMGERQAQLLVGRPRVRHSARIYFNRKEDTGPQTPCSRRASLQKSSQSCFLLPSKVLSFSEEKEDNGFY